jgi:hypothetical protein
MLELVGSSVRRLAQNAKGAKFDSGQARELETTQKYLGVTDSGKLRPQIDAAFGD